MDLFLIFLPFNLDTFLTTLHDGDTFPITQYILICLHILKNSIRSWSLPTRVFVVDITSSLRKNNSIKHLLFIFSLIWQRAIPQGTLSYYFSCLSPFIFMTEAEKPQAILCPYILLTICLCSTQWHPYCPTFHFKDISRIRDIWKEWHLEGREKYLLSVMGILYLASHFILIPSLFHRREHCVSERLSKLSKIKLQFISLQSQEV